MSLDQDLRRVLNDDRHAPSAWPDAVERITSGVRRRRRRRAVVAAAVVVLAVLGVSATVTAMSGRPGKVAPGESDVRPWIDAPAPVPSMARTSPRGERAPCTGDRFGQSWLDTRAGSEHSKIQTVLAPPLNFETCTLKDPVRLIVMDLESGQRVDLPMTAAEPERARYAHFPATVTPGEPARFDVQTTDVCPTRGPRIRSTGATVVLPNGTFQVDALRIDTTCPIRVGSWYTVPHLLNAPVIATISAPAQVQRGTTLDYTVTLKAAGGRGPLFFGACPVYGQRLYADSWKVPDVYEKLNCGRFGAGRYAMRLHVPLDTTPGPYKLSWMAVMSDGEVAIANMDRGGVDVRVV